MSARRVREHTIIPEDTDYESELQTAYSRKAEIEELTRGDIAPDMRADLVTEYQKLDDYVADLLAAEYIDRKRTEDAYIEDAIESELHAHGTI